ncbi:MAG: hypothetical protein RJA81_1708, partial [Planctomycetota bacterium]
MRILAGNRSSVWDASYDTIFVKSIAHLGTHQTGLMDTNRETAQASATPENRGGTNPSLSAFKKTGRLSRVHPLEILIVLAFLSLVFLLGIFPLKDTDVWWHLRTGAWILKNRTRPYNYLYTYTVSPDVRWIDLHWGFQVLLSIGYGLGGVPLLNLAKCVITTAAVGLLLFGCRRPGWPLWVSVVSWLPALLVLSGRMYIRPETISLLWMSILLVILFHWHKHPRLMWFMPLVFLFWVNTQGLFALGFVLFGFGLIEAALLPRTWSRDYRPWWSRAIATLFLCLLACLVNPYGIRGLMFPVELAGTMGNPVFRSIGELTPVPQFIQSLGFIEFPNNFSLSTLPVALRIILSHFTEFPLPLQLHLFTMLVGFLSFLFGTVGGFFVYLNQKSTYKVVKKTKQKTVTQSDRRRARTRRSRDSSDEDTEVSIRSHQKRPAITNNLSFSVFRILAFLFFSYLSFQATRNSHQYAAILGTITAANFAQWAGSLQSQKKNQGKQSEKISLSPGNALTFVLLCLLIGWVGSGGFYKQAGEGRTVGLGEEPLWFPHEAVKSAGKKGLPPRFASFHNGHASLYDYYWGPEKKVFSDARLEVIGPNLYQDQIRLSTALNTSDPSWRAMISSASRPVVLADHQANSGVSVTLLAANDYTCIHFDPIASVFVPQESLRTSGITPFDFFNAHYSESGFRNNRLAERRALARALRNISAGLGSVQRDDLARPLMLAGLGLTNSLVREDPSSFEAWKYLGQLLQVGFVSPVTRERSPESFLVETDLDQVRSIYALKQAQRLDPQDFSNLYSLILLQRGLAHYDQEFDSLSKLTKLVPINKTQAAEIQNAVGRMSTLRQIMGLTGNNLSDSKSGQPGLPQNIAEGLANPLPKSGASRSEIERNVSVFLRDGQIQRAIEILEVNLPVEAAPEELLEKLGGLRL